MIPIPPILKRWLEENMTRLFQKSPKFFRWWQTICAVLFCVSGLPWVVEKFETVFNFTLGEPFDTLKNEIVAAFAVGFYWASSLTVTSPVVGQTKEGSAVKVTDDKKLPFTSEAEEKKMEAAEPPPDVLPNVPEANEVNGSEVTGSQEYIVYLFSLTT